jgi:hypothetical protein
LDALIAESAIRSHCAVLSSVNVHHDGRIGNLTLNNSLLDWRSPAGAELQPQTWMALKAQVLSRSAPRLH